MLREAAAQTWNVTVEEITTKSGALFHEKSGSSANYGELASKAATIPVPKTVKTKIVKDFSIVSKSKKNVEGIKFLLESHCLAWIIAKKECLLP